MPEPTHIHHTRSATAKVMKRSVNGGQNKSVTKKDGAGRYNVGKEIDTYVHVMDSGDPNFDPSEEGGVILEATE